MTIREPERAQQFVLLGACILSFFLECMLVTHRKMLTLLVLVLEESSSASLGVHGGYSCDSTGYSVEQRAGNIQYSIQYDRPHPRFLGIGESVYFVYLPSNWNYQE